MITLKKIKIYIQGAIDSGTTRVLSEDKLIRGNKDNIDIIFIREDGWTLGCEEKYFNDALERYEWVGYTKKPFTEITFLK